MYDILRDAEKGHGFGDEVKYLMGVLSAEDFKQMVATRCAFLDPFVTDRHGAETHRIQWWMIIQDMTENPGSYDDNVSAGELFSASLSEDAFETLENNVWYVCVDAQQGRCTTARAPESLKAHFVDKYEYIKLAEEGQMKWDTTVKMSFETWRGLVSAGRLMEKNWEVRQLGKRS